jgi:outer membrane protein OmpA-like peptidoglycan-associated protein
MEAFVRELSRNVIKQAEFTVMETSVKEGKISFEEYASDLGDMREGMLVIKYVNGAAEIRALPEEVKRIKKDEIIRSVLEESSASIIMETREKGAEIVMRKEEWMKLGIKKDGKIYLVNYGRRLFLFKDTATAENFIEKLKEAGALVGKDNLKELKGVYINDEVSIKKEDIKELEDLSKGIIIEDYKYDIKEIKSAAREEEKKKAEEINKIKIDEAQVRREKPVIKSYRLNIANFGTNEYELTQEAKETIKRQAKEIREDESKMITVEGHADSIGTDEINKKISRKRGECVYKEFLLNGIASEKINYIGFGSAMPIDTNKTEEGRAANRRTEIFVE